MYNNFLGRLKEKSYYYKIISLLLLLSIVPIVIINLIVYFNIQGNINKQLSNSRQMLLKQTSNSMVTIIDQITDGCRQMTLDQVFTNFSNISVAQAQYYETLQGAYSPDDLQGMGNY